MSESTRSHAVFDSKIGPLAVAWNERGLLGVQLPEATRAKTLARIAQRAGSRAAPAPPWVKRAVKQMQALVAGAPAELDALPLDFASVPVFHAKVYAALRKLRAGETCTYAELARAAGSPSAARAVGQAMRRNPWPLVIPCHRVLAAGDRLGGFSAAGGVALKAQLLRAEATLPRIAVHRPRQAPPRPTVASRARAARKHPPQAVLEPPLARSMHQRSGPLAFDVAAALRHLREQDPRLGGLIDRVPFTLAPPPYASTFEALLRTIVYQQLNGKAAATIHGRVIDLLPGKRIEAKALLALPPQALRGAGLSQSKVAAVRDLAQKAVDGAVPDFAALASLGDEEIVERLTVVRGIGRWSAEMLLMFWLGRPDVLPLGDFGVRHGFQVLMERRSMPTERILERHARCWRPYRSVASWYMWRAVDEARAAKIQAAAR